MRRGGAGGRSLCGTGRDALEEVDASDGGGADDEDVRRAPRLACGFVELEQLLALGQVALDEGGQGGQLRPRGLHADKLLWQGPIPHLQRRHLRAPAPQVPLPQVVALDAPRLALEGGVRGVVVRISALRLLLPLELFLRRRGGDGAATYAGPSPPERTLSILPRARFRACFSASSAPSVPLSPPSAALSSTPPPNSDSTLSFTTLRWRLRPAEAVCAAARLSAPARDSNESPPASSASDSSDSLPESPTEASPATKSSSSASPEAAMARGGTQCARLCRPCCPLRGDPGRRRRIPTHCGMQPELGAGRGGGATATERSRSQPPSAASGPLPCCWVGGRWVQ